MEETTKTDDTPRSANGDASRAECEARQFLTRVWGDIAHDLDEPDEELRADALLDIAFHRMESETLSNEAQLLLLDETRGEQLARTVVA